MAFLGIHNVKTQPFFQDNNLTTNFVRIFIDKCYFTRILFVWKLSFFMENFEKNGMIFPKIPKFSKFQNPRWQFHSHVQPTAFVGKQSVLSLKLYSWGRFPHSLILGQKRENMTSLWRHLQPTYQSLEKFLWSGSLVTRLPTNLRPRGSSPTTLSNKTLQICANSRSSRRGRHHHLPSSLIMLLPGRMSLLFYLTMTSWTT